MQRMVVCPPFTKYGSACDMMRQHGIRYSYAGENLAKTSSAANAVKLFLAAADIVPYQPTFQPNRIGVYQHGRQVYVTQMFIESDSVIYELVHTPFSLVFTSPLTFNHHTMI